MKESTKKLLIVTGKDDVHADYIIQILNNSGFADYIIRLNTEDVVENVVVSFNSGVMYLELKDSGRCFSSEDICCVWYRKPNDIIVPESYAVEVHEFMKGQWTALLDGLYYLLSDTAFWINPRSSARFSSNKIKQMQVANRIGFEVPETIITNKPEDVLKRLSNCSVVCVKDFDTYGRTLYQGKYPIYSLRTEKRQLIENVESVKFCPTLVQDFIDKVLDLRVTVIGQNMYGVAIHSQEMEQASADFRVVSPTLLRHTPHDLPQELKKMIREFMNYYRLVYSAFDFAVTRDEKYYFLENNPNGQWLWLELESGVPISEGFIDVFKSVLGW